MSIMPQPLPSRWAAMPSTAPMVTTPVPPMPSTIPDQPSRPSAKALYARQGPLTDAELLDFGFTHADLF